MCSSGGHYRINPQEMYFMPQLFRKVCECLEGRWCFCFGQVPVPGSVVHGERGVRFGLVVKGVELD